MKRWMSWFALLLLHTAAIAQPPGIDRVRATARFEPAEISPGSVVTLVVEGTVEAGYHVYGSSETTGIPVGLNVGTPPEGLTAEGSPEIPPGEAHMSEFGSQEAWLQGTFTLRQTFRVSADAKSGELGLSGHIAYQACNEHLCEPPAKATFQAALAVKGGGEAKPEPTWNEAARIRYRAHFDPAKVPAGGVTKLILEVEVDEGWHLYGALEENSTVTTLTFPEPQGLVLEKTDVPPGDRKEPFPDFVTYVLPHAFRIEATLSLPAGTAAGVHRVGANLNYMACTDETCDPEQNVRFQVPLTVEALRILPPKEEPAGPSNDEWKEAKRIRYRTTFAPAEAAPGDTVTMKVEVVTEDGWHLYGAREAQSIPTTLTIQPVSSFDVVNVTVPDGELHEPFEGFKQYELPKTFTIEAQLKLGKDVAGGVLVGADLHYMACTEGTCDPDQTIALRALLKVDPAKAKQGSDGSQTNAGTKPNDEGGNTGVTPNQDATGGDGNEASLSPDEENTKSLLGFLIAAIGAGLFALVMPCTYPMIPITISFFTKQADARGGKVLPLSLAYGAGIVSIFIVIGVLFGGPIIQFANHEITNLVIGALFVLFALSLFGMFELRPPQFLMRAASQASSQGGYFGVFLMGATLVITSFTCTGPFVGSLLSIGGKNLSLFQVALGMGVFGLTMALPFVVLSLVPGKLKALPKSGSWMDTVKVTLGFVELAASLKFFSNAEYTLGWMVLPVEYFMLIWAVIFLVMGLYLLGKIRLAGKDDKGISPGRMVLATVTLIFASYCGFIASTKTTVTNFIMVGLVPPYALDEKHDEAVVITDAYGKAREAAAVGHMALLINFTGFN